MPLVILEGLSATGKSTLAPLVADHLKATFLDSIPRSFREARLEVDQQDDVNVRHLFYATALAVRTVAIRSKLEDDATILLESYIDRTNCFHRAMGSTAVIDDSLYISPRITVLIECTEAKRLRRLAERRGDPANPWQRRTEAVAGDIRRQYEALNCEVRVSTDTRDVDDTATYIASEVQRFL